MSHVQSSRPRRRPPAAAKSAHTGGLPKGGGQPTDLGGLDHGQMRALLGYNLAQALVTASVVYDGHLGGPLDLRQVDFTILTLIGSNDDVTLKTLAEALGIAPSNLTVIVDRSVARNLVVREPSEDDRRSRHLRLTASGRTLLDSAWAVARHMESALLEPFSAAERAMLFELLGRVALRRMGGDALVRQAEHDQPAQMQGADPPG